MSTSMHHAAFNSVNRHSLWLLLKVKGIPPKIIQLMGDLYSIPVDGQMSDWFDITAGFRQGYVIAPDKFLEPIDWIIHWSTHRGNAGLTLGKVFFTDLDFAYDVAIMS